MKLECKVCKVLSVDKHTNADRLCVVKVLGYSCISKMNDDGTYPYKKGDYVVYIPEFSLLPNWLLRELGFWDNENNKGLLFGSDNNRVKAIRLRGQYSEGLLYPVINKDNQLYIDKTHFDNETHVFELIPVSEGQDVSSYFGIEKWVPPMPVEMAGVMQFGIQKYVVKYDIEPIQKFPDALQDTEIVEFAEKIHGCQTRYIFSGKNNAENDIFGENNNIFITSKGIGDKGFYIKNTDDNKNNVYVRAFVDNDIENKVKKSKWYTPDNQITLFGETYGVQDLMYGLEKGKLGYALFDVFIGNPQEGRFLNFKECIEFSEETGIPRVPSLYVGPYSKNIVSEYTSGKTAVSNINQIREGIVIRPLNERTFNRLGRVILKSVSEAYKLRKDGTEYN